MDMADIATTLRKVTGVREWNKRKRAEFLAGVAFTSPWTIGLVLFLAYPILASLYFSFTRYDLPKPPRWVGAANYVKLFTRDRFFRQALWNSFYLTALGIPSQLVIGLLCAMLLNLEIRGQAIWRTIYVLPMLMPAVASAVLWQWLLNPQLGLINQVLKLIGAKGPLWLANPKWSKPSILMMQAWSVGSVTIIYLAALQGVPEELYEAAQLDGAGPWRKFVHITLPLISPVTLFQLITGIIWSLQYFTGAYILGGGSAAGSPQGSLRFYGLYLYAQAFEYLKMGYASALAWVLFIVSIIVTLALLRSSRHWAHYEVI
jgi:multiple sugar transport system permease protein